MKVTIPCIGPVTLPPGMSAQHFLQGYFAVVTPRDCDLSCVKQGCTYKHTLGHCFRLEASAK